MGQNSYFSFFEKKRYLLLLLLFCCFLKQNSVFEAMIICYAIHVTHGESGTGGSFYSRHCCPLSGRNAVVLLFVLCFIVAAAAVLKEPVINTSTYVSQSAGNKVTKCVV